ncbi:MAG: hypothetical protein IKJ95_04420, partial [Bacteroidaceae bacterium]|nr:hypothetical protein [Bacteroidaceae bacterium]
YFQKSNRLKLWNLTVPVKEITCAYHCAIVHHDRAKRRGICFFITTANILLTHTFLLLSQNMR